MRDFGLYDADGVLLERADNREALEKRFLALIKEGQQITLTPLRFSTLTEEEKFQLLEDKLTSQKEFNDRASGVGLTHYSHINLSIEELQWLFDKASEALNK